MPSAFAVKARFYHSLMEMTLSVFAAQTAFVEIVAQKGLKVKKETQEEVDEEDRRETWGSQG